MNTPNATQDPQTAIDYNLYPSSARPSGLEVPQPEQETQVVACPVCSGRGNVPRGFYAQTTGNWGGTSLEPESCRSCFGTGILDTRRDILKRQVESLQAELSTFHTAMQRERKPDWEKWHMDLADIVDSISSTDEVASIKTPVSQLDVPGTLKTAARELRYMATSFTLKANFVPTDLEIKALKEQVESLEKQCALQRKTITAFVDAVTTHEVFFALGGKPTEALKLAGQLAKECEATTAGHNYKSPEEVAAIVDKCDKETTEFQFEIDNLHSQLTAHTQALKVAKEVLERVWEEDECGWIVDPETQGKSQECVKCGAITPNQPHAEDCTQEFIQKALATINNLLK